MIRTTIAFAVALLVWEPLFVSPAAACISCEYTPEVVNTPHPSARKKKRDTVARERPARKRTAPREIIAVPKHRVPKDAVAKDVVVAPKEEAPADAAPATASVAKEAPAAETYTASKKPSAAPADSDDDRTDNRPSMQASTETPQPSSAGASGKAKPVEEAKAPEELGCKKFIPTAGITISVACE